MLRKLCCLQAKRFGKKTAKDRKHFGKERTFIATFSVGCSSEGAVLVLWFVGALPLGPDSLRQEDSSDHDEKRRGRSNNRPRNPRGRAFAGFLALKRETGVCWKKRGKERERASAHCIWPFRLSRGGRRTLCSGLPARCTPFGKRAGIRRIGTAAARLCTARLRSARQRIPGNCLKPFWSGG